CDSRGKSQSPVREIPFPSANFRSRPRNSFPKRETLIPSAKFLSQAGKSDADREFSFPGAKFVSRQQPIEFAVLRQHGFQLPDRTLIERRLPDETSKLLAHSATNIGRFEKKRGRALPGSVRSIALAQNRAIADPDGGRCIQRV